MSNTVKDTVRKHYVRIIDRSARMLANLEPPSEGWLAAMRGALAMSGAQVAKRMGVTRAAVHQAERNEREGAITIKQMEKLAEAMGGRFIYAIVPESNIESLIRAQALRKAESRIRRAGAHMALESQALPEAEMRRKIETLADDLARDMPSDFWEER